jgi:hypothetical protein
MIQRSQASFRMQWKTFGYLWAERENINKKAHCIASRGQPLFFVFSLTIDYYACSLIDMPRRLRIDFEGAI